jgi:AbrB family looped-hinge helix DNA binding protein
MVVVTKIAHGGRVVIPAEYRQALGLHVGDEVILQLEDNQLRLFTPRQAIRHAQAIVRQYIPQERSLAEELLAGRRAEAARE